MLRNFRFNLLLNLRFNLLLNRHSYTKPSPYQNSVFIQPFTLSSEVNTVGVQTITLHVQPDWLGNYTAVYGAAPFGGVNVDGMRVVSIDGQVRTILCVHFV